jgi:hypothetical protein
MEHKPSFLIIHILCHLFFCRGAFANLLVQQYCSDNEIAVCNSLRDNNIVVNVLGETYNSPRKLYIASENFYPKLHRICYMIIDTSFSGQSLSVPAHCFADDVKVDLFRFSLENIVGKNVEFSMLQLFVLHKPSNFLISSSTFFLGDDVIKTVSNRLSVDVIIFSKDRPSELENLLASIDRFVCGHRTIHVVYRATSPCFEDGYKILETDFNIVKFYREADENYQGRNSYTFMEAVFKCLDTDATHVLPMVSEMLFIRPVNVLELAQHLHNFHPLSSVQLRLGTHLELYSHFLSKYAEKFIPSAVNKIHRFENLQVFDATITQSIECVGKRKFFNEFWYIATIAGSLFSRKLLQFQWKEIGNFSHPGQLEMLWYQKMYTMYRYHLMPIKAYCVHHETNVET